MPTFAKSNTDNLERHLVVSHDAIIGHESTRGTAIEHHFPKAATIAQKIALVCMNPTVPFHVVEDPFFKQAFGHSFGRNGLPEEIYLLADGMPMLNILLLFA